MKKPRRFNHIFIDFFGGVNFYWIRCEREHYVELIKEEFGLRASLKRADRGATFETAEKENQWIGNIWLGLDATLMEIVHECVHAAHWLCDDRGIWLTDSSEEVYAYLVGMLVDKIYKHEAKQKK